jgi:hypothetical protein
MGAAQQRHPPCSRSLRMCECLPGSQLASALTRRH